MKKYMPIIILTGLLFTHAMAGTLSAREKHWLSLYKERAHDGSYITGITYSSHANPRRDLVQPYGKIGLKFGSIKRAFPYIDDDGTVVESDDFLALDGAVGMMVGQSLFAYGEVGVDLGEMIWDSLVEDDGLNDIDFFTALGVGVQFSHVKLNVYGKYNWINGLFIEHHQAGYIGTEIAVSF